MFFTHAEVLYFFSCAHIAFGGAHHGANSRIPAYFSTRNANQNRITIDESDILSYDEIGAQKKFGVDRWWEAAMSVNMWRRLALRFRAAPRHEIVFGLGCVFIAAVSVHDAVLVILNHDVIEHVEQNPIGKWLIAAQDGDVWLFVCLKLGGTSLACTILVSLYRSRRRLAWGAVTGLVIFQFVLLLYLIFA